MKTNYHDQQLHVSHVTLRVANIKRSTSFYHDIIGLDVLDSTTQTVVLGSNENQILTLVEEEGTFTKSAGLYHIAFLQPSLPDLANWYKQVLRPSELRYGASDHLVSYAFYLEDPDGNGVEVYADTDDKTWFHDNGIINMTTRMLPLHRLVSMATDEPLDSIQIGHLHLQATDITKQEEFLHLLGFDTMMKLGQAVFVSNGNYHHHLAVNRWGLRPTDTYQESSYGITQYTIVVPNQQVQDTIEQRLNLANWPHVNDNCVETKDAIGILLKIQIHKGDPT